MVSNVHLVLSSIRRISIEGKTTSICILLCFKRITYELSAFHLLEDDHHRINHDINLPISSDRVLWTLCISIPFQSEIYQFAGSEC